MYCIVLHFLVEMSYSGDRKAYQALLQQWAQGLKSLDVNAVRSMAQTTMSAANAKMAPNIGIDQIVNYLRQNNYPRLVVCKLYPVAFTKSARKPSVVMAEVAGKQRKVAVFDGKGPEVGSAYNFTLGWKASCVPVFEVKTSKKTRKQYIQGLRSDGKGSGYHHRYFKLSGSRAAQMTFITDLKVAIKTAYEEAHITDAVIMDEDVGSLPYALYRKNRSAITAMKMRGKTVIQGMGATSSIPDEPTSSLNDMEEQEEDGSGSLSKRVKPNPPLVPPPTPVATFSNTTPVVNTLAPLTDSDFNNFLEHAPSPAFAGAIDQNVHKLLDDLDTVGRNQHITMSYDFATRVVAREPTAMIDVRKSRDPMYELDLAQLIIYPNLNNFYAAYNNSPRTGGIANTVLADVVMSAVEHKVHEDTIELILAKFFDITKTDDVNAEEKWLDYMEEHQIMQYDGTKHEIIWPDLGETIESDGDTAYINPTTSATS